MSTEMNTEMSAPTPRTDAAVKLTFAAGHNTVCPNFARTLERELADANASLSTMIEQSRVDSRVAGIAICKESAAITRAEKAEAHVKALEKTLKDLGNVPASYISDGLNRDWEKQRDNLAILLRRSLRKLDPSDPLRTCCIAYLKQIGRAGSPLRGMSAEAELTTEREKAERYRLATLKQDAALAAEREKVRTLRLACDQICEEWGCNHDTNPIGAGQRMSTRAGKALEATEDGS